MPQYYDVNAVEDYYRRGAVARGMDPDIVVAGFRKEGLQPGVWQSNVVRPDGTRERSYGPSQLYLGGGLGNEMYKKTGYNPSDPANVYHAADFTLDKLKEGGWGPWYGPQKAGITGRMGLDGKWTGPMPTPPENLAAQGIAGLPTVGEQLNKNVTDAASTAKQDPVGGIFNALLQQKLQQPVPVPEDEMSRRPDQRSLQEKVASTSQTPDAYIADIQKRYL